MWPAETRLEHKLFEAVFELVAGFLLPVGLMAVCYTRLLLELLRNAAATSGRRSQLTLTITKTIIMSLTLKDLERNYSVAQKLGIVFVRLNFIKD